MRYAQRDVNGKIIGDATHPNRLTESTPVDEKSQEWVNYLNPPLVRSIAIESKLTEDEKRKVVDLFRSSGIITAEKAERLKTQ